MPDQLTPTQVENIRKWHCGLLSGNFTELRKHPAYYANVNGVMHFCAVGVACQLLDPEVIMKSALCTGAVSRLTGLPDVGCISKISSSFTFGGWTYADCARFLSDYMLENYCIDLSEPSATAPSESQVKL